MRGAQLRRLLRWVKWIAKARQTDNAPFPIELLGDEARDATAHRFATDEERYTRRQRRRGSAIFLREALGFGRGLSYALPSRRHVSKLEPVCGEAPFRQQRRDRAKERRLHAGTGAVRTKKAHGSIRRACDHELGDRLAHVPWQTHTSPIESRGIPTVQAWSVPRTGFSTPRNGPETTPAITPRPRQAAAAAHRCLHRRPQAEARQASARRGRLARDAW